MATHPREGERQSDLAVMDANEYKQKRRLERILDTLDDVEHKANEAWDLFVAGEITAAGKNIIIQRAVKEAIRESYNLLHEYARDDETDSKYWTREHAQAEGNDAGPLGEIPQQTRRNILVWGLRDFIQTETVYHEEKTEWVKPRNQPTEQRTEVVEQTVPEEVSWTAFLMLKRFLCVEHDLEVTFEELDDGTPTWGFKEVDSADTNGEEVI